MEIVTGYCAYEGIVIADVFVENTETMQIKYKNISPQNVISEQNRLNIALSKTIFFLNNLKTKLRKEMKDDELRIIDAHLLLLEDPMFIGDIKKCISKEFNCVETAVEKTIKKYVELFSNKDNETFKQRSADIQDVGKRILDVLNDNETSYQQYQNKILVTKELFPSQLLHLYEKNIHLKGIITEIGGETSHLAILAKSLKIPSLIGVKKIFNYNWQNQIILDTTESEGIAIINPDNTQLENSQKKIENRIKLEKEIEKVHNLPSITKDGVNINLYLNFANIDVGKSFDCKDKNISGIGLLRTEFLFMKSKEFPDVETQYKIYKQLIDKFDKNQTITIRTLDIGADKQLSYFQMKKETNPFLGLRGIRFSLANKEIFKQQLKAILMLSYNRNIKIMYPMVTSVDEVIEANSILESVKNELRTSNIQFDENIKVGIMVEVPSVIIMADSFAEEIDFFSIGSNDLTQYLLATDRLSETVDNIYDNFHPAVIKALSYMGEIGKKHGKDISVCGEMAGNIKGALALMALNITNLSMVEPSISPIKALIRNINFSDLSTLKTSLLSAKNTREIKLILKKYIENLGV